MGRRLESRSALGTPWVLVIVAGGVLLLVFLALLVIICVAWVIAEFSSGAWAPHPS